MLTLPSGSRNGLYPSWKHHTGVASPAGSGSLSPPMSRASSPLHAIGEVFAAQRASWPVAPLSLSDRQNSDSESRSSVVTTSVSFSYSVKSINSRKSRLVVRYPRPVRPQQRLSGVESILESAGASLESFSPLSSRPVSLSMSPQGNLASIAENEVSLEVEEGCWHQQNWYLDFHDSILRTRWKPFLCSLTHLPGITSPLSVVSPHPGRRY
jgi:hypothetical protein